MIKVSYDNILQKCDLDRSSGRNFTDDPTLETAVLISLFTNRLASSDDVLPNEKTTRKGWWADVYSSFTDDNIGSRLWLLGREKMTQDTINQAKTYAEESLQWMVDDGVAESVTVTTTRSGSMLVVGVEIIKPTTPTTKWSAVWRAHFELL